MSKILIKPIFDTVKIYAPKIVDYVKKNPEKVIMTVTKVVTLGKTGIDKIKSGGDRFERGTLKGKVHFRKLEYIKFQNKILPNLDSYSYSDLISFKLDAENYIKQISQEEDDQLIANKPLNSRRRKSWEKIHIQIEDKIKSKNYVEFLKIHNSPTYVSDYFDDIFISNIRNTDNKEELYKYIFRYTERDLKEIEKDFS